VAEHNIANDHSFLYLRHRQLIQARGRRERCMWRAWWRSRSRTAARSPGRGAGGCVRSDLGWLPRALQ